MGPLYPVINLFTNDPGQVTNASVLDIFLGTPQVHMLIFTGIAIPGLGVDNGDTAARTVIVHLGRTAVPPLLPTNFAATVGLASIANTDSEFTFASNDVTVAIDDQTGELLLTCTIVVQGDESTLNRFSYQATVLIQTNEPLISGQIIWKNNVAGALPQFAGNLFTVEADILLPGPQGQLGGQFVKVADGTVVYPPVQTSDGFFLDYVIENPPLNTPLFILCGPVDGAFLPAQPPPGRLICSQISGISPVTLDVQNLQVSGIDFLLIWLPGNK